LRVSAGAVLDGTLTTAGRTFDVRPGVVAAVSLSKQWMRGAWFATGTVGAGVSRTSTLEMQTGAASQTLVATDLLRLGATVGRTFGSDGPTFSPYLMARGFVGPVSWNFNAADVTGSDTHKYALGAGASFATKSDFALLADVSAVGERSVSLAASLRL
jgi:hypothetical protein